MFVTRYDVKLYSFNCCIKLLTNVTAHFTGNADDAAIMQKYTISVWSSDINLLTVACTSLGAHSFSVASPKIWNSLPPALHSCNCPDTFTGTSRLITSSKLFHSHRYLPPHSSDSTFVDIVCVYKFHLLIVLLLVNNG